MVFLFKHLLTVISSFVEFNKIICVHLSVHLPVCRSLASIPATVGL